MIKSKPIRRSLVLAASLIAVSLCASQAIAQAGSKQEMIARADTNGDGDISWAEVSELRLETFNRVDRNGDGVVNSEDSPPRAFAGRFNEAMDTLRADFDTDRDGEITQEEMLNAPAPMFETGDVNQDGILTAEEMADLRASLPGQ